jgi:class 3 adenylate cyclase
MLLWTDGFDLNISNRLVFFFFPKVILLLFWIVTHVYIPNPDIAGFTEWCSTRQPVEVFFLLETLYGAFDTIAGRRNVFKIETIGDCYVAVTGLPQPQPDHAIIMVRFANDILQKTKIELSESIGPALGTDSISLELRIGLNSGPVIAGVLRGEKARFQLFGDTMNTGT